jgi:hypothetical protein
VVEALYAAAALPVRDDIVAAHTHLRRHAAEPGTWWSGRERLAIWEEARRAASCGLCAERRAALSPAAVSGEHEHAGALPETLVEVVHRVRSDPARLSRRWLDELLARGLSDAAYVEAVGVAVRGIGMDVFARAVGVEPAPLPQPLPGEPSRHRPAAARDEGAWVPMIAQVDAAGPEADLYPPDAYFPNVGRALSLVPDEVRANRELLAAHYLDFHEVVDVRNERTLPRSQVELLATRVSALHDCFY